MAFYHRIPVKYMRLVPAIFFALGGVIDIGADLWHHKLTTGGFLFNFMLLVPLLVNHRLVHLCCGMLFGALSLYLFFALFVYLNRYLNGSHFSHAFEMFTIGPLLASLSLICSLSLIYVGTLTHPKPQTV